NHERTTCTESCNRGVERRTWRRWMAQDRCSQSYRQGNLIAILEAKDRGFVETCKVTHLQSPHPEWKLVGPTGTTEKFIRDTRVSKKVWAAATVGVMIVGFLAWLI